MEVLWALAFQTKIDKVLLNTDYVLDISMSVEYIPVTPYLWHWFLLTRELIFV